MGLDRRGWRLLRHQRWAVLRARRPAHVLDTLRRGRPDRRDERERQSLGPPVVLDTSGDGAEHVHRSRRAAGTNGGLVVDRGRLAALLRLRWCALQLGGGGLVVARRVRGAERPHAGLRRLTALRKLRSRHGLRSEPRLLRRTRRLPRRRVREPQPGELAHDMGCGDHQLVRRQQQLRRPPGDELDHEFR